MTHFRPIAAESDNVPPLNVLYSDNHLLVIDKPAGIATMGSEAGMPTIARQAAEYLRQKHNKPGKAFIGVVSRLDRLVSGVLVLARTSKAASRLSAQIREQQVDKLYVAVVEGAWPVGTPEADIPSAAHHSTGVDTWCELVDWVAKDESSHRMRVVPATAPGAQQARMRVQPLARSRQQTLLRVELITGRKHQIRLQLAEHGTPICGDSKYGARSSFGTGIALHCQQVKLLHPTLKTSLTFRSSPLTHWTGLPQSFRQHLN